MALIIVIEVKRDKQFIPYLSDRIYQKTVNLPKKGREFFSKIEIDLKEVDQFYDKKKRQ